MWIVETTEIIQVTEFLPPTWEIWDVFLASRFANFSRQLQNEPGVWEHLYSLFPIPLLNNLKYILFMWKAEILRRERKKKRGERKGGRKSVIEGEGDRENIYKSSVYWLTCPKGHKDRAGPGQSLGPGAPSRPPTSLGYQQPKVLGHLPLPAPLPSKGH